MRNLPENRDPRKKPSTPLQSTPILQPKREKGEHAKRKEGEKNHEEKLLTKVLKKP